MREHGAAGVSAELALRCYTSNLIGREASLVLRSMRSMVARSSAISARARACAYDPRGSESILKMTSNFESEIAKEYRRPGNVLISYSLTGY